MISVIVILGGIISVMFYQDRQIERQPLSARSERQRLISAQEEAALLAGVNLNLRTVVGAHRRMYKLYKKKWKEWTQVELNNTSKEILYGWIYKGVTPEQSMSLFSGESGTRKNARSPVGAKGLGQLMRPSWDEIVDDIWWRELDPWNPADSALVGIEYFSKDMKRGKRYGKRWSFIHNVGAYNSGFLYYFTWYKRNDRAKYKELYRETRQLKIRVHWYYTNYLKNKWDVVWHNQSYSNYGPYWETK